MMKTRRELLGMTAAALGSAALSCATRSQESAGRGPGSEQIKETMQAEAETTTTRPARSVERVLANSAEHWVGDGFRVRSVINPQGDPRIQSPFLLLDHAPSRYFEPGTHRRGVGEHPHRGFETVTFAYRGEVAHRDSSGGGGLIGAGDVQWMTAAGGVVHEELHSQRFTEQGGDMEMVQLWVNLPAKHKMDKPGYQALLDKDFPRLQLEAAKARLIAGSLKSERGPARTHTPMTILDLTFLEAGPTTLELPRGFTTLAFTLEGDVYVGADQRQIQPGAMAVLGRDSDGPLQLQAAKDARVLVLSAEPINEPVAAYGPFVMNTRAEIIQAMEDYQSGKMGHLS